MGYGGASYVGVTWRAGGSDNYVQMWIYNYVILFAVRRYYAQCTCSGLLRHLPLAVLLYSA